MSNTKKTSQQICCKCNFPHEPTFQFCPNCGNVNEVTPFKQSLYKFKKQHQINVRSSEKKMDIAIGKIALGIAELVSVVLTGGMDAPAIVGVAKSISTAVINLKWSHKSQIQTFHHHELTNDVWIFIRSKYSTKIKEGTFSSSYQLRMYGVIVAIQPANQSAYNTLQSLVTKDAETTIDKIQSILQLEEKASSSSVNKQQITDITKQVQYELDIGGAEDSDDSDDSGDIIHYQDNINPKCTFSYHLLYGMVGLFIVWVLHFIFTLMDDNLAGIIGIYVLIVVGLGLIVAVQRINSYHGRLCNCCHQRCWILFALWWSLTFSIVNWILIFALGIKDGLTIFIAVVETGLTIFLLWKLTPKYKWQYRLKKSSSDKKKPGEVKPYKF